MLVEPGEASHIVILLAVTLLRRDHLIYIRSCYRIPSATRILQFVLPFALRLHSITLFPVMTIRSDLQRFP